MKLSAFLKLIQQGEKSTVDFKLCCNAFNRDAGDHAKAKAELVKDICAMANNGAATSYLIVGMGDDRKTVQSVGDANLNSANIQSLVRDSIHPRPTVRVHLETWGEGPSSFRGVRFVIVQIGPNPRQAYRFARDFISLPDRFHFRKNEVWIRNEDTSDLATPEQIGRLLGMRRLVAAEAEPDFPVTEYQKLPRKEQIGAFKADALAFLDDVGAKVVPIAPPNDALAENYGHSRVSVKVRGQPFLFRCVFLPRLSSEMDRHFGLPSAWTCEHGFLIFVMSSFSDSGKFRSLSVDARYRWGSLGLLSLNDSSRFSRDRPTKFAPIELSVITLPRLSDTKILRETCANLFAELRTDDVIFDHVDRARRAMNKELRRWFRKSDRAVKAGFPSYSDERAVSFQRQLATAIKHL